MQVWPAFRNFPHAMRWAAVSTLGRSHQRTLYDKAAGAPAATTDFVPADRAPLESVTHLGKNSLPLPRTFQLFEKRFCRSSTDAGRLFGYNEGASRPLVGPGYFVAYPTSGSEPDWSRRGGVVVDYFDVPDGPVAPGWPKVVPNSRGLQRFVFYQTRDFMRRVCEGVTIGAAYKVEKKLDHYFVLVRQQP